MSKSKLRSSSRRRRRMTLRRLFACGLIVIGFLGGVSVWHHFAPPATQERIEAVTLDVIDFVRENSMTPDEMVFWLDLLSDKVPLARGRTASPGVPVEYDSMVLGGTPATREDLKFLKNKGYLAAYDENRRNPAWVAYRVFEPKFQSGKRPEKFEPDPRTRAKVSAAAYTNSGYDRGHMAPNHAIAVCYGAEAQRETFLMSNVAPQLHGLNGAFWESMEARVINRHTRRFGQVWVICGPVYDEGGDHAKLGSGVTVPDAFFLIIATHENSPGGAANAAGLVRMQAYLVPHRNIPAREDPAKFLVSVREIERRTGLDFFPLFPGETQAALESEAAKRAW